jgi:hypothetical protein
MRNSAGDKRGVVVAEFASPALHQANGRSGYDGDRLAEVVNVAGQRSSRKKTAMPAANALRTQSPRKQIEKERIPGELINSAGVIADNGLRIRFGGVSVAALFAAKDVIHQVPVGRRIGECAVAMSSRAGRSFRTM